MRPLFHDPFILIVVGLVAILLLCLKLVRIPATADRRTARIVLVVITLVGLVFRLWTAAITDRFYEIPVRLVGDEGDYNALAHALLNGSFFQSPKTTPVYPLFLAACYFVFDYSYPAVLYVQAFVGSATILLTYRLARHVTSRKGSLFASALVALNPILIWQTTMLYTETLYTFLLLFTVLSLLWALQAPTISRFALLGVLFAVATLCRPGTALLALIMPFLMPNYWSVQRRVALCLACGAAMVMAIAPWTYHNFRTYHTFLPLAVSRTLLWHGSPEFYHVMQTRPNAILTVWEEELNPAWNGGHEPLTIEGDRYFNRRAVESILREPGTYFLYSVQKPVYFWIGHPAAPYEWPFDYNALHTYYSPSRAFITASGSLIRRFVIISTRLGLVLAALLSIVILRHRLHEFAPMLAICGYFMMLHTLTFPLARYSEPLYPILAVLIASAVGELIAKLSTGQRAQDPKPGIHPPSSDPLPNYRIY